MLKIFFPLFLLTVQFSFAQVLERPFQLPDDSKQIPPLNQVNQIDTLQEGLYRSTFGVNLGYETPGFFHGIFNDKEMIIPFEYCGLSKDYSHFMIAKKHNIGVGVIDSLNNVIIPFEYSDIYPINPDLPVHENKYFKAYKGKKMGLINKKGEVIIPIEYANIKPLQNSEEVFIIEDQNKKSGIANLDHSILTDCNYSGGIGYLNHIYLKTFSRKVVDNSVNRRHGSINHLGEEILPAIYKSITLSLDGKYLIAFDGLHSKLFDQKGNIVFQKDSMEIKNLVQGIYTWFVNNESVIVQKDFTETLPMGGFTTTMSPKFYTIKSSLKKEGNSFGPRLFGVNNYLGQEILPIRFSKVLYLHDDLFFARANGSPLYAIYDGQGNEIVPPSYSFVATSSTQAFTIVAKPDSDKLALLNGQSQAITPFIYDNIHFSPPRNNQPFQIIGERENKRFRILSDGKEEEKIIGYINKNERILRIQKNDSIATESLKRNYHTLVLTKKDSILIQYQFEGGGKGKRIIHYQDKKGSEQKIIQTFNLKITCVGLSGELPWLWLWLEEPSIYNNRISNFFKLNKIDSDQENFPIKVKYSYTDPEVLELIETK